MRTRDLDEIVQTFDLNQHPFYRAWRDGTLPRRALEAYASDYEAFIATIELGWSALGDAAHAAEERRHAELWGDFRRELGGAAGPACPEVVELALEARRAFAEEASSLGALYAFEAQQPSTAASKLEGLRQHYALSDGACAYFRIHADDYGERERLAARAGGLEGEGERQALAACERLSRAMWSALDGLLRDHGRPCA